MKKVKLLAVAAFVIGIGSAFAPKAAARIERKLTVTAFVLEAP